jgi:hypothetical protein
MYNYGRVGDRELRVLKATERHDRTVSERPHICDLDKMHVVTSDYYSTRRKISLRSTTEENGCERKIICYMLSNISMGDAKFF